MSDQHTSSHYATNLALAGICQAAAIVKQVARSNEFDGDSLYTVINSLTITDPDTPEQVYGDVTKLKFGFETLLSQLGNDSKKDVEITRYIANLLSIERKLSKSPQVMAELGNRIANIQRQQLHLSLLDSQMLRNLNSVYTDVISPLGRRIQVGGDPVLLKREDNQFRVRAALLGGVRSAVLWRQLGGRRRQILFNRKPILNSAQHTFNHIIKSN